MSRKPAKTIDQMEADQGVDKRAEPKEFEIRREPSGLYRVYFTAGGEVPDSLKSMWTSVVRAQNAIDNELALRKQREEQAAG